MPPGVEHAIVNGGETAAILDPRVEASECRKGVEHNASTFRVAAHACVSNSQMPQGVEHVS
jgi:hypothetical protein